MHKRPQLWRRLAYGAALAALSYGHAEAVNVSPNGLGQVLLFPYYTARGVGGAVNNTIFSVTNTDSTKAKVLRVWIMEGKAGAVVLDFNLFLAPGQTWSAVTVPQVSGGGGLLTASRACTIPAFPSSAVNFVNFVYAGDGMGDGLDRTLEGHIEVIEMATYAPGSQTYAATTPISGVASCAINETTAAGEAQAPTGKVMGYAEIVNPLGGTSYAAVPTGLDAFNATAQYFNSASSRPNLTDVSPATATLTISNTLIVANGFSRTVDAVSAVLMHNYIYNQFTSDTAFGSATDWAVTFPTKYHYYTAGVPVSLFQRSVSAGRACDDVILGVNLVPQDTLPVSHTVCFATNVLTFNGGSVLGSSNAVNVATSSTGGFAAFVPPGLPSSGAVHRLHAASAQFSTVNPVTGLVNTTFGSVTLSGLPAIGFAARRALSGLIEIPDGSYQTTNADTAQHKYLGSFTSP